MEILPKIVFATNQLTSSLFDSDDITADDFLGAVSFKPLGVYRNDNASFFSWIYRGSGDTVFRMSGDWVY